MIFKAYLKQNCEGCDYTIGCAQTVIDIEADSQDAAMNELRRIILEEYNEDSDNDLESAELYCISELIDADVKDLYAQWKASKRKKRLEETEAAERAQLQRLKNKYERGKE